MPIVRHALIFTQEHVSEPHRKTVTLSPYMYGTMGLRVAYDRVRTKASDTKVLVMRFVDSHLCRSFYNVLLTRFLLGILEASFFPGALFLISKWYKHNELGLRTTIFSCGGTISYAFGALIASAILDMMEGVLGMAAWRWLFFVEGGLTIVVAFCAMLVLPDFPETQRPGWLSEREIRLANRRMQEDSDHAIKSRTSKKTLMKEGFWMAMKDGNVFLLTLTMAGQIVTVSFTVYFPTIAATLGYNRNTTLLLCAPPFLVAAVLSFFVSRCVNFFCTEGNTYTNANLLVTLTRLANDSNISLYPSR